MTSYFNGTLAFGSTVLTSAQNSIDVFVAKYVPSTNTWPWATRGGGSHFDFGFGIAVRGSNVYVVSTIGNNAANANAVLFAGAAPAVALHGMGIISGSDLVLVKYVDNGTSATLAWTPAAGGTDTALAVAVSRAAVYATGYLTNTAANASGVVLGGTGTTPGTVAQAGASPISSRDLLVAPYTNNGPTATSIPPLHQQHHHSPISLQAIFDRHVLPY